MQISQEETPALVVSCEFCEFFKKTHFAEHLRTVINPYFSDDFRWKETIDMK